MTDKTKTAKMKKYLIILVLNKNLLIEKRFFQGWGYVCKKITILGHIFNKLRRP